MAPVSPRSIARAGDITILGIDPGSQVTGFGAVQLRGRKIEFAGFGVIAPPRTLSFHDRIGAIAEELEILFSRLKPHVTVIERVFLGKNADSAFKLGHARGVALSAAVIAGSEVVEYATRAVKKGITGNGGATKGQVQAVLAAQLRIRKSVRLDASDALALAFHHAGRIEVECRTTQMREMEF